MRTFNLAKIMVFVIPFLILGCSGDEVNADEPESVLPIEYAFINNTTRTLVSVNLATHTYFADRDYTTTKFENFKDVPPFDTLVITVNQDSLNNFQLVDDPLFDGYRVEWDIEIWMPLDASNDAVYVSSWKSEYDTIRTITDPDPLLIWPNDTSSLNKESGRVLFLKSGG